jgi:hypothetical protein
MYATPQLLDQFVWVPVRDAFISSCGHTGLTVLEAVLREMEPPFAVSEAAEHALPLFSRLPPALDPGVSPWELAGPGHPCQSAQRTPAPGGAGCSRSCGPAGRLTSAGPGMSFLSY